MTDGLVAEKVFKVYYGIADLEAIGMDADQARQEAQEALYGSC